MLGQGGQPHRRLVTGPALTRLGTAPSPSSPRARALSGSMNHLACRQPCVVVPLVQRPQALVPDLYDSSVARSSYAPQGRVRERLLAAPGPPAPERPGRPLKRIPQSGPVRCPDMRQGYGAQLRQEAAAKLGESDLGYSTSAALATRMPRPEPPLNSGTGCRRLRPEVEDYRHHDTQETLCAQS